MWWVEMAGSFVAGAAFWAGVVWLGERIGHD